MKDNILCKYVTSAHVHSPQIIGAMKRINIGILWSYKRRGSYRLQVRTVPIFEIAKIKDWKLHKLCDRYLKVMMLHSWFAFFTFPISV